MLGVSGTAISKTQLLPSSRPAVWGQGQTDKHTITAKCYHFTKRGAPLEAEGITICQEREARKVYQEGVKHMGSCQQVGAHRQKVLQTEVCLVSSGADWESEDLRGRE